VVFDAGTGDEPFAGLAARSISHCEARETGRRLYLLFVARATFYDRAGHERKWQEDPEPAKFLPMHALGCRAIARVID
jgi:hypothetical protein